MRIPFLPREKATYAKLRNVGLSINQIAKFSGRSTSVIQRALKLLEKRGIVHKSVWMHSFDMRKLPYQVRLRLNRSRWTKMLELWAAWQAFLLGESEKPP